MRIAAGGSMREFQYQGAHWRVREVDTSRIPGARGLRCLIFDSEGIVRRVWAFPDGWAVLDDDGVWNLLDSRLPSPLAPPAVERRAVPRGDHAAVVAAAQTAARGRSRAIE